MKKDLFIPKLGLTMTDAMIVDLLKEEGDPVKKEEVVITLETDKVTHDIEAPQSGYIHYIGKKHQKYPINTEIGWVASDKEEYRFLLEQENIDQEKIKKTENKEKKKKQTASLQQKKDKKERLFISPSALRIAKEKGINPENIKGTGPNGRIVKKDILLFSEKKLETDIGVKKIQKIIPIQGTREIIYNKMQESLRNTAQLTISMEICADSLFRFRKSLDEIFNKNNLKISYNAIILKVISKSLEGFPIMNSSVMNNNIYLWDTINIGLALEGKDGSLMVPVIKDTKDKTLKTIQKEISELIEKEKSNQLNHDDLQGGTFTLTSLGIFGVETFTPIINPPESGILGVGKIIEKPIIDDGKIRIGKKMMLNLTFDHRIIDGAVAARFLKTIKSYIEEPYLLYEMEMD